MSYLLKIANDAYEKTAFTFTPTMARAAEMGIGGLAGGAVGYATASDEHKKRNAMLGALGGAGLAYGAHAYGNTMTKRYDSHAANHYAKAESVVNETFDKYDPIIKNHAKSVHEDIATAAYTDKTYMRRDAYDARRTRADTKNPDAFIRNMSKRIYDMSVKGFRRNRAGLKDFTAPDSYHRYAVGSNLADRAVLDDFVSKHNIGAPQQVAQDYSNKLFGGLRGMSKATTQSNRYVDNFESAKNMASDFKDRHAFGFKGEAGISSYESSKAMQGSQEASDFVSRARADGVGKARKEQNWEFHDKAKQKRSEEWARQRQQEDAEWKKQRQRQGYSNGSGRYSNSGNSGGYSGNSGSSGGGRRNSGYNPFRSDASSEHYTTLNMDKSNFTKKKEVDKHIRTMQRANHPDLTTDAGEKKHRTELMKGINNAADAVRGSDWYEKLASFQQMYGNSWDAKLASFRQSYGDYR